MSEPPKKTKISLPSFKEVQAAQRSVRAAPNLFQNRSASGGTGVFANEGPDNGRSESTAYPSSAPPARPDGHRPVTTIPNFPGGQAGAPGASSSRGGLNPNAPSLGEPSSGSAPLGVRPAFSSGAGPSQGTGIFSQEYQAAGPSGNAMPQNQSFHPAARPMVEYNALNAAPNAILVSKRQEGNPLLKHIRNVRWNYADIIPDYIMGADTCALFLSMRFHLLKPDYIHHRIKELQKSFRLRILMCYVDIDDVVEPLQQITRAAILNGVTLICGWSPEECARYLETYKAYETKPADMIKGHMDEDFLSRLTAALTTIRGVNKTDVLTLGGTFKTAANIMQAPMKDLAACPGIGPTKVQRIYDTFHEPFRKSLKPASIQSTLASGEAGPSRFVTATGSQALNSGTQQPVLDGMGVMSDIEGSDDEDEDDDPDVS